MVNAQIWLEENYPKEKQEKIKKLDISNKELDGDLKLERFTSLETLDCSNNKLTTLEITNCLKISILDCHNNKLVSLAWDNLPNLAHLACSDNLLTKLDLDKLEAKKLITLGLVNNNFPEQDLSCFNKFVKLEKLYLGANDKAKIQKDVYNRFSGSLGHLKNCTKLKELSIASTDIDSGLELLSDSRNLDKIYCFNFSDGEVGCTKIQKQLEGCLDESKCYYRFQTWKKTQKIAKPQQNSSPSRGSISSDSLRSFFSNSDSAPLSPTSTIQKSFASEFIEVSELKERVQELTEKNVELVSELEEIKKELEKEKQKNQSLKEKISFQNKLIQSREELIRAQKEIINTKDKLIDNLDNSNPSYCRNILLIGHTGSGKSTLANMLINKENKFKEYNSIKSGTKDIQVEEFEHQGIKYRVIDTIGIDDNTGLTNEEIMQRIAETTYKMRNGVTQILFVTKDRFSKSEIDIYNLLRGTIFDEKVAKYTTIVRTNSTSFEDNEWCEEERQEIIKSGGELAEVISSCNKFIYVDNGNRENRENSRSILLSHLTTCWGTYRPQNLKELSLIIGEQMKEKEKYQLKEVNLQKEIKKMEDKISEGKIEKGEGENIIELKNKELVEVNQLEKMINININNNLSQHMQELAEEKGLGKLWLEVIGKSLNEAWEVAKGKCQIM